VGNHGLRPEEGGLALGLFRGTIFEDAPSRGFLIFLFLYVEIMND